jgi:hypothetical protein
MQFRLLVIICALAAGFMHVWRACLHVAAAACKHGQVNGTDISLLAWQVVIEGLMHDIWHSPCVSFVTS